jgi:hypothetical protein
MKRKTFLPVALLALFACAGKLHAQTCHGTAPITNDRPVQFGGGVSFSETLTRFRGSVVGGSSDFFAGIEAGANSYDDLDESSTIIGVGGGAQVAADAAGRVVICPEVAFAREFGPNNLGGSNSDLSTSAFGGGISVGVIASETNTVQFVPTFGVSLARAKFKVETNLASVSETDTLGTINLGVGVVMNRRFSVVPAIGIPFGRDDNDVVFGISVAVSWGGR